MGISLGVCSSKANRIKYRNEQTQNETNVPYFAQIDNTDDLDIGKGPTNTILFKPKTFKKNYSVKQDNTLDYCSHLITAYVLDKDNVIIIPNPIQRLILTYYPLTLKYKIYAIKHSSIHCKKKYQTPPIFDRLKPLENIVKYCTKIYPSNNSYIIKNNNKIYKMSDIYNHNKPIIIKQNSNYDIEYMRSSKHHTLIKLENGSIYTSDKVYSSSIFQKITVFDKKFYKLFSGFNEKENIIEMECGSDHSLLLSDRGRVYSMGNNDKGQCGLGDLMVPFISTPTLISKFVNINRKIKYISCGEQSSCCVDEKAHYLWCWGDRYVATPTIHLLSTINSANINVIKAKCGKSATVALDSNGYCYVLGEMMRGRSRLNKNIRFKDFDIAPNYIILISSKNNIYKLNIEWNNRARNICKLDKNLFPNLQPNSIVHSVVIAGNTTMIMFH